MGCASGGDDNISLRGLLKHLLIGNGGTVKFFGQLLRMVKITVANENRLGALINQMAGGELAHMSCANY